MSVGTILLIILVLLLVGALPSWPYSSGWGYYPAGGLGTVLLIIIILLLLLITIMINSMTPNENYVVRDITRLSRVCHDDCRRRQQQQQQQAHVPVVIITMIDR